ncbi:MAG: MtaA/CmuA family methyltransferase [Candidatus Methanogranum gryphiswaldense]|nr:MAG: MtaA/CmuA family methyltransferase [Candidatus Methanogranum sp. U3.2.1]
MTVSPRERVLSTINGESYDRPPVAIFTQSVTVSQMDRKGIFWPEANYDPEMMSVLGASAAEMFGFEAVRAPFCLSVEAERLGCNIDKGKKDRTPMVKDHPYKLGLLEENNQFPFFIGSEEFISEGRPRTVIDAIDIMSKKYGEEYPVIAGTTGPLTLVGHLVSIEDLIMGTIIAPDESLKWVKLVEPLCRGYVQALSDAGADIIQMSEGAGSPDIIMPDMFEKFSGQFIRTCLSNVKGANSSLHICGDAEPILEKMVNTGVDCLSIEEKVDPYTAVERIGGKTILVGNIGAVSPLLMGTQSECRNVTAKIIDAGFDIIAPGCGVSPHTTDENLCSIVNAVKGMYD